MNVTVQMQLAQQNDDSGLWSRVQAGQGEALGLLFDRHSQRIYRRALGLLGNPEDAQDAVAIVFLELCRNQHRLHLTNGSIAPWLLGTTTNVCRNLARSARRYRSALATLPSPPHGQPAEAVALARATITDALDPVLATAFERLPAKTQALLLLTAVDGYTIGEAAHAVGISAGAARTRLSRARADIREAKTATSSRRQTEEE